MATGPVTTTAPLLNGQIIGITYHAIAAVRDQLLAAHGLTFHQSVTLKAVADGLDRAGVVDRMTSTLKVDASRAHALLDELAAGGLLDGVRPTPPSLTDKGESLHRGLTDAIAGLTERLYGDLPAAEREIAARLLAHVTARANAELAAPSTRA
ncbi:hypothetical protein NJL88_03025 [Streptomyces sp. DK15]|uniref:hypothetical protein n=1 Tax=Streptomyces sp. DK15 TaxID=2957499 RepID=UPI0029BC80F1|nr:hypothetical protein [Streptomyces sp. DK15]MDX2389077.1 hypothetical protein [Streptomyces sp. DK15]